MTTKVPCCPATRWERYCNATGVCASLGSDTAQQIEHDLKTLNLTYVDLMLIHWPCDTLDETMQTYRVMEDMVEKGTARAIGVSNFNATMLRALYDKAKVKPVVNQCALSIGDHNAPEWGRDDETVRTCKELNVTFEAYSPLGGWYVATGYLARRALLPANRSFARTIAVDDPGHEGEPDTS